MNDHEIWSAAAKLLRGGICEVVVPQQEYIANDIFEVALRADRLRARFLAMHRLTRKGIEQLSSDGEILRCLSANNAGVTKGCVSPHQEIIYGQNTSGYC